MVTSMHSHAGAWEQENPFGDWILEFANDERRRVEENISIVFAREELLGENMLTDQILEEIRAFREAHAKKFNLIFSFPRSPSGNATDPEQYHAFHGQMVTSMHSHAGAWERGFLLSQE